MLTIPFLTVQTAVHQEQGPIPTASMVKIGLTINPRSAAIRLPIPGPHQLALHGSLMGTSDRSLPGSRHCGWPWTVQLVWYAGAEPVAVRGGLFMSDIPFCNRTQGRRALFKNHRLSDQSN